MNDEKLLEQLKQEITQWQPDCWDAIKNTPPPTGMNTIPQKARTWQRHMAVYAAAAVMILGLSGLASYFTPMTYVAIDINPSIELDVNLFNRVIGATGANDEGSVIVAEAKLKNMTVSHATQAIVASAIDLGYLDGQSEKNAIMLAVDSYGNQRQTTIQNSLMDTVDQTLNQQNVSAQVLKQNIKHNQQTQSMANELGISESKMQLINQMQQIDPNISIDSLKGQSISKIAHYAKQKHMNLDILEDWDDELDDWEDDDRWEEDHDDQDEDRDDEWKENKKKPNHSKPVMTPNNGKSQNQSNGGKPVEDVEDLDDDDHDDDDHDDDDQKEQKEINKDNKKQEKEASKQQKFDEKNKVNPSDQKGDQSQEWDNDEDDPVALDEEQSDDSEQEDDENDDDHDESDDND